MLDGKFTKQDVLKLTGFTRYQIQYLDEIDLIKPEKLSRKVILYTWNQLLELRTLSELRKTVSLRKINDARNYLTKIFDNEKNLLVLFKDKKIVVSDSEIFLINNTEDTFNVFQLSGKHKGQFIIHQVLELNNVISELHKDGRKLIPDYDKQLTDILGKQSHNIVRIYDRKVA